MDVIKRRDAFLFVSPSPSMDSPVSVPLLDSGAKNYTTVPTGTNVTWELATLSPVVSRVVSVPTSVATASTAEGTSALQGAAMAAQALVLLSIFLLSSVGNSAVAVVIIKHRRLRTATNAFILSLSLSDLLAAVLCLPVSFVTLFSGDGAWVFGERFCVANGFFNTCFGIVSTLTMTLISFDRYPSPYRYHAIVRQPQAKIGRREAARLLAGVWLTAVLFSLPWGLLARAPPAVTATEAATATAAGANRKRGFHHCVYAFHTGGAAHSVSLVAVCFLLPFALMCFCHYGICRTVRLSEVRVRPATTYACLLRFHGEVRTATTVLLMIVFVVLCRGPYCLVGLAAALGDRHAFSPAVVTVAIWLAWANGAVNPVIYALRNPNISVLLGRGGREEGYRTGGAAGRAQIHEMRLNQVGQVRERYASHVRANQQQQQQQQQHSRHSSSTNRCTSSSSPGHAGSGAEVATWAYKNPAVLFCRDLQLNTPADGNGFAPKVKTADTSL